LLRHSSIKVFYFVLILKLKFTYLVWAKVEKYLNFDVLGILFNMLNVLLGITNALLDALDVPPSPTSSTLQSSLFICHQTPIFNF
jgi:hypothetical protein